MSAIPIDAAVLFGIWIALTVEYHLWVRHQPAMIKRRRDDYGWKTHVLHLAIICIGLSLLWVIRLVLVVGWRDVVQGHYFAFRGWRAARRYEKNPAPEAAYNPHVQVVELPPPPAGKVRDITKECPVRTPDGSTYFEPWVEYRDYV